MVPAGKPNSIEGTHTYQYDAFGRRVAKAVGGTTPSTTVYVSKTAGLPNSPFAGQELAEYGLGVAATNPVRKYAYGRYIDDLLLYVERSAAGDAGSGVDEKLYVHTDRRFSVTALTNATGGVAERYTYTPYGEIAVFDGAGVARGGTGIYGLSVAYTGRKLDRESGLYFFRARYHDPRLGRFTTRDPLFYPDGPNAYAAWFGVGDVDPGGLDGFPVFPGPGGAPSIFPMPLPGSILEPPTETPGGSPIWESIAGACGSFESKRKTRATRVLRNNSFVVRNAQILERANQELAAFDTASRTAWGCPNGTRCCQLKVVSADITVDVVVNATIPSSFGSLKVSLLIQTNFFSETALGLCVANNCPCPPALPPTRYRIYFPLPIEVPFTP